MLKIAATPGSTRTDTLFPDTTLVRSASGSGRAQGAMQRRCAPEDRAAGHQDPERRSTQSAGTVLQDRRNSQGDQARLHDQFHSLPAYRPMERSEEHTSELQSLMRISYAVFCLKTKHYTLNYIHI